METSVGTPVTMPTIPVHEAVAPGSTTEQDGGHSGTTKGGERALWTEGRVKGQSSLLNDELFTVC